MAGTWESLKAPNLKVIWELGVPQRMSVFVTSKLLVGAMLRKLVPSVNRIPLVMVNSFCLWHCSNALKCTTEAAPVVEFYLVMIIFFPGHKHDHIVTVYLTKLCCKFVMI